jgi:cytochrome c
MDSFELNKIIGSILGTLLFVMGAGFLAEAIYAPKVGGGPGYALPEPEATPGEGPAEEVVIDLGTLLASANLQQGEGSARKCAGCHNFAEGAGNKQGPELFGVVGRPIASHAGFGYSDALKALSADTWTYENLDHFLTAPKEFAPNTKMNFGGIKNAQERASLLAYLASVSPGAPAFPPPAPPTDATAEAAAGAEPSPEGDPATATGADATATPTTTQSETPVQGTPTTSAPAGGAEAPATTAPATEAPADTAPATEAPATTAPATTPQ